MNEGLYKETKRKSKFWHRFEDYADAFAENDFLNKVLENAHFFFKERAWHCVFLDSFAFKMPKNSPVVELKVFKLFTKNSSLSYLPELILKEAGAK